MYITVHNFEILVEDISWNKGPQVNLSFCTYCRQKWFNWILEGKDIQCWGSLSRLNLMIACITMRLLL